MKGVLLNEKSDELVCAKVQVTIPVVYGLSEKADLSDENKKNEIIRQISETFSQDFFKSIPFEDMNVSDVSRAEITPEPHTEMTYFSLDSEPSLSKD